MTFDLEKWLKYHGIKQIELARALGVHKNTVHRWLVYPSTLPPFLFDYLSLVEPQHIKMKGKKHETTK